MTEGILPILLLAWPLAVAALSLARSRRGSAGAGLMLAYVVNLWLIHWPGPALHLLPWYEAVNRNTVMLGLQESTYALVAFTFGGLVLAPFVFNCEFLPKPTAFHRPDRNLPLAYVTLGVIAFPLISIAQSIPSATALVSTGYKLVVVGLGLCCWHAWKTRDARRVAFWLGLTLALPFVTMTTMGFIGYGATATLTVLSFLSGFVEKKWAVIVAAGLCVGYLGLSTFVTYMRDRPQIRASVWSGESYGERLTRVGQTFMAFEWFDPWNMAHLDAVDSRLNQSYLVGLAVSRLEETNEFAYGDTFWKALIALIPRAVWPEKPDDLSAGSGSLVTEFTGVRFGSGTSVGIGHVMEFYVNFGTTGVIFGFLFMGLVVTMLDTMAAQSLAVNDLPSFVLWFLPGISLLQVGGSFVEVTTGIIASLTVAVVANAYLSRLQRKPFRSLSFRQRVLFKTRG
jgi:hypothetical protein